MSSTSKIYEHHKTRNSNCKGQKPEEAKTMDPNAWLYWCPNRMKWFSKKCECFNEIPTSKRFE